GVVRDIDSGAKLPGGARLCVLLQGVPPEMFRHWAVIVAGESDRSGVIPRPASVMVMVPSTKKDSGSKSPDSLAVLRVAVSLNVLTNEIVTEIRVPRLGSNRSNGNDWGFTGGLFRKLPPAGAGSE